MRRERPAMDACARVKRQARTPANVVGAVWVRRSRVFGKSRSAWPQRKRPPARFRELRQSSHRFTNSVATKLTRHSQGHATVEHICFAGRGRPPQPPYVYHAHSLGESLHPTFQWLHVVAGDPERQWLRVATAQSSLFGRDELRFLERWMIRFGLSFYGRAL
jgi:hypothetical protein